VVAAGARRLDDPQDGRAALVGWAQAGAGVSSCDDAGVVGGGIVLVEQRGEFDDDLGVGLIGQPEGPQARRDRLIDGPVGLLADLGLQPGARSAALILGQHVENIASVAPAVGASDGVTGAMRRFPRQ
jgi:hypothetical protein